MRYTFDSINAHCKRRFTQDFRVCSYNTTWMLSVRVNEYGGIEPIFKANTAKEIANYLYSLNKLRRLGVVK